MKKEKLVETADKLVADGKYDKALKSYQKVIESNPDDMRLRIKLGDLHIKRKDITAAIETYSQVAERYMQERFHLKAIAIYKMMLKLNPTMITVNEKLADLYREVGLQKDAVSQYFIVADHYEQTHQSDNLLEIRRKIVEADPTSVTSRIRLAEIYQKEGSVEDSLRQYERAAEDLRERNDKDALVEVYERIIYHRSDDARLFVELCRLYLEQDKLAKAQQRFEAATKALQQKPEMMELAIEIYLRLEQREKVRSLMKELYEHYTQQGDAERAVPIYARAREEFIDDKEFLGELDLLRQAAGQPVPAEQPVPSAEPAPAEERAPEPAPSLHAKISEEDLEKTTLVRVDEPQPAGVDLDKTVMVRVDDVPKPKKKPAATQKTAPRAAPRNDVDLDETLMVDVAELEKQAKGKKEG